MLHTYKQSKYIKYYKYRMNNINRMFNLVKYLFIILFNYRICNRNNTYTRLLFYWNQGPTFLDK